MMARLFFLDKERKFFYREFAFRKLLKVKWGANVFFLYSWNTCFVFQNAEICVDIAKMVKFS